jgi:diphosphomevalonate decarboxylase
MHAVMMTSTPPLFYWEPASLVLMKTIPEWRRQGLAACFTLDAGPNVHVICPADQADSVAARLKQVPGVLQVLTAGVGTAAHLVE